MFKYETHCHTSPASACAKASVSDTVQFYKCIGYDGIFITNHFLDGNINKEISELPSYSQKIERYFEDYEYGVKEGKRLGIDVFCGVELSYKGTDFLIYGLEKEWYLAHPEILDMKKSEELMFLMREGALVIQAHPFRERHYIDHVRLFPKCVHGVEIYNSSDPESANRMAKQYAAAYDLLTTAGSDNHWGRDVFNTLKAKNLKPEISGLMTNERIKNEKHFVNLVKSKKFEIFHIGCDSEIQPELTF